MPDDKPSRPPAPRRSTRSAVQGRSPAVSSLNPVFQAQRPATSSLPAGHWSARRTSSPARCGSAASRGTPRDSVPRTRRALRSPRRSARSPFDDSSPFSVSSRIGLHFSRPYPRIGNGSTIPCRDPQHRRIDSRKSLLSILATPSPARGDEGLVLLAGHAHPLFLIHQQQQQAPAHEKDDDGDDAQARGPRQLVDQSEDHGP